MLPFAIDDPEGNVLVWWARPELDQYCILGTRFLNNLISRCLRLVDKIWVEQVEFVALHNLGWRVVVVVVGLVVLVPFVTGMDSVEESWAAGSVFVLPHVCLLSLERCLNVERFLVASELFGGFLIEHDLGNKVVVGVLLASILVWVSSLGVELLVEYLATLVQLYNKGKNEIM